MIGTSTKIVSDVKIIRTRIRIDELCVEEEWGKKIEKLKSQPPTATVNRKD